MWKIHVRLKVAAAKRWFLGKRAQRKGDLASLDLASSSLNVLLWHLLISSITCQCEVFDRVMRTWQDCKINKCPSYFICCGTFTNLIRFLTTIKHVSSHIPHVLVQGLLGLFWKQTILLSEHQMSRSLTLNSHGRRNPNDQGKSGSLTRHHAKLRTPPW